MGKNMCLKCREKVIYKVYHNLQQHENLNLWNKVVCLLSIYLFRKRHFIIILNKMKNFILRTKFKSNLCRLSIFCNMREKFISSPLSVNGGLYTVIVRQSYSKCLLQKEMNSSSISIWWNKHVSSGLGRALLA